MRIQEIKDHIRSIHDLQQSGADKATRMQENKDLIRLIYDLGRSGVIEV